MNKHTKSLLQALIDGKQLEKLCGDEWKAVIDNFAMLYRYPHDKLRVKQPTIRIGDVDVPEPLRVAPAKGTLYWIADSTNCNMGWSDILSDDRTDERWLKRGFAHLSEEAAIAHSKALIAVSGGTV